MTVPLAGQALMPGQLDRFIPRPRQGPARTAFGRLRARGRHRKRLFLSCQLALRPAARRLAQGESQGCPGQNDADHDMRGNLAVTGSGIGRRQDPRPFQIARRVLAPARHPLQPIPLRSAQLHAVSYVHRGLLAERSSDESIRRAVSSPSRHRLHRETRPIPGLHSRLYQNQTNGSGRGRNAAIFPSLTANSPSHGPEAPPRRTHPTGPRTTRRHQNPSRPRRPSGPPMRQVQTVKNSVTSR